MTVHALKTADFEKFINTHELVFIDFWAEWCAPCKNFSVIFDKTSENFPEISFMTVNVEEESELSDMFEIRSIPYLMVFKQGILIYADAGSLPESALLELIEQAKTADMSSVKE